MHPQAQLSQDFKDTPIAVQRGSLRCGLADQSKHTPIWGQSDEAQPLPLQATRRSLKSSLKTWPGRKKLNSTTVGYLTFGLFYLSRIPRSCCFFVSRHHGSCAARAEAKTRYRRKPWNTTCYLQGYTLSAKRELADTAVTSNDCLQSAFVLQVFHESLAGMFCR